LSYEHHRPDGSEGPVEEPEGLPDRRGLPDRSQGAGDVRGDAGLDAGSGSPADVGDLLGDQSGNVSPEIANFAALVLAQISQHQHFHLAAQVPDADQLAELKAKVPEAYDLWIESTRKRTDHEIWQSRKSVRQPYLLATLGQWLGLVAVIAVLILAGVALTYGHGVVAGVLGVVDIIGLAAVFNGNQGRRQRKQRDGD
jgi:hypothetical protein